MKTVVILQSAYIPWKGYFHLIHEADLFIFHDDLQFTHSDWRSRNRILTASGPTWLSIPAGRNENRLICEVEINDASWKRKHRRTLQSAYGRTPHFADFEDLLDFLYDNDVSNLSEFNQRAIRRLARELGLSTTFDDSRSYDLSGRKTDRLIDLLTKVEAQRYLSGPAGRNYLDERQFAEAGIDLRYFEYPQYPDYEQHATSCVHEVSVLDMLFRLGAETREWIWGKRTDAI